VFIEAAFPQQKVYKLVNVLLHGDATLGSSTKRREGKMEMIAAAAAFVGLFSLWVVLPRVFLRK